MPDLYDQTIPPEDLPPAGPRPVFPDARARGTPAPAAPTPPTQNRAQEPATAPARQKPNKLDHPEYAKVETKFKFGESERARSVAVTVGRNHLATIHTEGVMGDLDNDGIDLLAGYIARINGVGFTLSSAHSAKNPGGFGLTLRANNNQPFSYLIPVIGSTDVPKWIIPMIDDLQKGLKTPNPMKFPTWAEGGGALLSYLNLIRIGKIPYFYRGPMTPIAEVLLCYEAPFCTEQTFGWAKLQVTLEEAEVFATTTHHKK